MRRLFGSCSRDVLDALAREIEHVELAAGETLFRQGDPADGLYVLEYGRMQAWVGADGQDANPVAELRRGEVIGEMSLIDGEPRSATVVAARDCRLTRISAASFDRIVARHPQVLQQVSAFIVAKLRRRDRSPGIREETSTIALVWAEADLAARQSLRGLDRELSKMGSTVRLRCDAVHRQLGLDPAEDHGGRLLEVMHDAESRHRFVIYDTGRSPAHWTRRALRQADVVLIVTRTGARPPDSLTDLVEPNLRGRVHVVHLHASQTELPHGTRHWSAVAPPPRNHHVRPDQAADVARLARCLAGRALGLVLSGGGARGFGHLGVIKAMEQAGIPIDRVGGTSMGAMMAGQYATGVPVDELIVRNRRLFAEQKVTRDYTLPLVGLMKGRKAHAALKNTFGDPDIEDLWLSFFAVASDLTRARQHVFESGSLWHAVRCSTAVPIFWIPVFDGGRMYADGALMNNLPTDVMRGTAPGRVVAVDVGGEEDFSVDADLSECPSSARLLWRKSNPLAKPLRVPSLRNVLARSLTCSAVSNARQSRAAADHYLRPPVGGYRLLEFDSVEQIVERSYRWASEHLERFPVSV